MDDEYEVSVTIGVRQLRPMAGPGFQASDTVVMPIRGFSDLAVLLGQIHDLTQALKPNDGPQDRRR